MNALMRWWYNLTLPSPHKTARNHVYAAFMVGSSRTDIWRASMKEAAAMRERGVNEPWLQRYLEACKAEITALHGVGT
jgi:hypothetical protein